MLSRSAQALGWRSRGCGPKSKGLWDAPLLGTGKRALSPAQAPCSGPSPERQERWHLLALERVQLSPDRAASTRGRGSSEEISSGSFLLRRELEPFPQHSRSERSVRVVPAQRLPPSRAGFRREVLPACGPGDMRSQVPLAKDLACLITNPEREKVSVSITKSITFWSSKNGDFSIANGVTAIVLKLKY